MGPRARGETPLNFTVMQRDSDDIIEPANGLEDDITRGELARAHVEMSLKIREETQLKPAAGQSRVICMQPLRTRNLASFVKKSKSFSSVWEFNTLKLTPRRACDHYYFCQAEQAVFPRALPLVPLTKNESFLYEYGEARLVLSGEWNICKVDSCPPVLAETSKVGKRRSVSPIIFFSQENINSSRTDIREGTLGGDCEEEIRSVEITEKLCNDLLLRNKKLGEENNRLLSHNTKLEKQISEITKKLFVWESNYSKRRKADTKLEADLRNIEQDTESKDERIRELNRTIEALWITADELADRKVDLTMRIGKLQNEIKEKHDQLRKNRKEETVDTQVANMPRRT
ncbi:uncharacterized protein LOC119965596 isoform X2 [Scyliorhinus canicula]|uniref:uncharacterized protein LOC119965596 isoform X2 n=1 Tax=Scyliorhinus canicula TaxID=7830 RepID=UPI0018F6441D|nr:uncharacterized protein LOC119965596 isoform X2 [Scyliorhinus canicula]